MNLRIILSTCLILFSLSTAQAAEPHDSHADIHPYLTDDVVAVAYVDLRAVDLEAMLELAEKSGWLYPEDMQNLQEQARQIQSTLDDLAGLGLERIYATFRMSDVQYTAPVFVLPVANGGDPEKLQNALRDLPGMPFAWERTERESILLGALSEYTMQGANSDKQIGQVALAARNTQPKQELLDALDTLGNGDAGLAIVGDSDSRRVIREMMPALPAPFQAIDGKFVADELAWGGISAKLPPSLHAALEIQAYSKQSAELVQDNLTKAIGMGQMLIAQGAKDNPDQGFEKVAEALGKLRPRVDERRVVFSLGNSPEEFASLVDLIAQPVRAARKAAYRSQRMNNFKQIMLAVHNHASARKESIPTDILSDKGKPLLSWRVVALDYTEEQALYRQFHLDEPWDSEHNLKLAKQIPALYRDPDPAIVRELKEPWYTTFLGVAGPGTVFDGSGDMTFKNITDGTSNTVFLVEVTPEQAVPWTKPADWEVDFEKPFDGVERKDRQGFVCGFCDGSARYIATDHPGEKKNWPKQLTIAGGELIEW